MSMITENVAQIRSRIAAAPGLPGATRRTSACAPQQK